MSEETIKEVQIQAFLYSLNPPTEEQKEKILEFLKNKTDQYVSLIWKQDETLKHGFRIEVGTSVHQWNLESIYDYTLEDKTKQLKNKLLKSVQNEGDSLVLMRQAIEDIEFLLEAKEIGTVISVGDGIAWISGLPNVEYGEILLFDTGIKGMVQDLKQERVGCILFGDDSLISEGSIAMRTEKIAGIPVGNNYIGRVIDALGNPVDGKGEIKSDSYYPIENPAPSITDRQPVNEPLETGILTIDSMFPIGKGQRELIIGDRQTGKTSIAIDTILNQKGKDVICIYVAIGQKASSVAQLYETLNKQEAMKYSIILNAPASETAPLQYLAPYAGCALAEYFMNQGKDVLIVYDDLSKHAVAYRELSLLLERAPGREAYPGDVFYLHSRLLERAAHLSEEKGGGSMSALPIVETQSGDVSAYIPTNIISITDGQIFLESNLFFSGQRPAVNVGLSVSRVGTDAQTHAMKKAAGAIRLELAQYREMEVFTQFASDLDETTKRQLDFGQGLMMLLRQKQNNPLLLHQQVILLITALDHIYQQIPISLIQSFSKEVITTLEREEKEICETIDTTGKLEEEQIQTILSVAKKLKEARIQNA